MINQGNKLRNETREKIAELEKQHDITLSTTQKILLSLKGPVTPILDVLYGTVNLFVLDQHLMKADETMVDLLDVEIGDEIDSREVIVHKNGRPLVYARSYIPTARCSDAVLKDLADKRLTTGNIMAKNNIETMRKINEIYIEKPSPILQELFHTSEFMVARRYIMVHGKKPVIWTEEKYPISYFRDE